MPGIIYALFVIAFTIGPANSGTTREANAARNVVLTERAVARVKRTLAQAAHPSHPCHMKPSAQDIALDAAWTAEKANVDRAMSEMMANLHHDPSSDAAYDTAETRALDAQTALAAIEDAVAAQVDAHGFTCTPSSIKH